MLNTPSKQAGALQQDALEVLAAWVSHLTFDAIPTAVIDHQKKLVLDVLGAALAGVGAEGVHAVRQLVLEWGGTPQSTILGSDQRVPAPSAVLVNSTMARALEIDDVHETALVHATVAVVPAVLAMAERLGDVDGRAFLTAVVAGSEVACRVALAARRGGNVEASTRGISFTNQVATFAAAAAAAKLLDFDAARTAQALGVAYSAVAGNQQSIAEGTLSLRVQQGLSAQSGVVAALLADRGITGPRQALEGKFGLYRVFHQGQYERGAAVGELGTRFEVSQIAIKPYPCCKYTHTSIDATLHATTKRRIDAADIERIDVVLDQRASVSGLIWNLVCDPLERRRVPESPAEAQFSLPYVVAVGAIRGEVRLEDFASAAFRDPAVLAVAARVLPRLETRASGTTLSSADSPVRVTVHLGDGRLLRGESSHPLGHPENPMSWDQVLAKFEASAAFGLGPALRARCQDLATSVRHLESCSDVGMLASLA